MARSTKSHKIVRATVPLVVIYVMHGKRVMFLFRTTYLASMTISFSNTFFQ